jgi:hypothetical protein
MGDNISRTVRASRFEVHFRFVDGHPADTAEECDAEVTLPNGTRWSATFMTLRQIAHTMDRWRQTEECLGGHYFQCSDLVIIREGGVASMVKAIEGILDEGGPEGMLKSLDD